MESLSAAGLAVAAGYLCGSLPFAWIAVKVRTGTDLRTTGSGNVGATNAARVLGKAWFPPLFALDAAKGAGAVLMAGGLSGGVPGDPDWIRIAGAAGAILGHVFPCWIGFRGGKAVAAGAGAVLVLSPWAAAAGFAGFLLAAAGWRFVSIGSIAAAVGAAGAQGWVSRGTPAGDRLPVEGFLWLLALVVLLLHVPNLRRIAAGTEPRIFGKHASPAAGKEPARED